MNFQPIQSEGKRDSRAAQMTKNSQIVGVRSNRGSNDQVKEENSSYSVEVKSEVAMIKNPINRQIRKGGKTRENA